VPEKKIFQEEEKNMKKIGYFFKKGRKKRRKRTFKPGGLFHYQIKADSSFIFTFLLLISSAALADVPINIFKTTNLYAKFLDHSKIKSIITDNLELSEDLHYKVNVKVMYEKSGKPDYLIVYILSNETYFYETIRIDIDGDYNVDSIKEKYKETKADYSQGTVDIYASCPNDSIEMVFATSETGIPTAVNGVKAIAQTARNAGYSVQTLLGSSENRSAILNWLACDNLIFFGRIGHGSTSGIMVSNGTLSYTDFQNMSSNALNDKVLYFNSCQVHNSPLQPSVVSAGVQKYIGGIDNLSIGPSEEVFKCVADNAIAQHESLTSSLASCEASEYPYIGAHGISGNGSDYVGDGGSSGDCSAPTMNVTDISSSSISVSWNNAGANSYKVYYLKSGGSSWT
ncbi:MAG: hypothetical protein GY710_04035, partial [Desulfobacteraceae bacterium]|nr:hypothetical protein [Desulfobacteraceae bacterium]